MLAGVCLEWTTIKFMFLCVLPSLLATDSTDLLVPLWSPAQKKPFKKIFFGDVQYFDCLSNKFCSPYLRPTLGWALNEHPGHKVLIKKLLEAGNLPPSGMHQTPSSNTACLVNPPCLPGSLLVVASAYLELAGQ